MPISSEHHSEHYWLGYLAQALRGAIETIEAGNADRTLIGSLKRSVAEFESSPVKRPREIVGFAIVDPLGECYAITTDYVEAVKRQAEATNYLWDAWSSGHPAAPGWVSDRLPIAILTIDEQERESLLEEGTPTLEREP